ncbi:MAG: hypothetical protein M3R52_08870 [Acidobacteriota bacterium]|nr:hypothetical protein [Acidobacteriota bacterium]
MFKRSDFILTVLVTLLSGLLLPHRSFSRAVQASTTGYAEGPGAFSDWSAPVNIDNLGSTVNSSVIDQHPALSRDGQSLYFISDRTPGVGGLDIWVCQRGRSIGKVRKVFTWGH